jgi:hypothetical protein
MEEKKSLHFCWKRNLGFSEKIYFFYQNPVEGLSKNINRKRLFDLHKKFLHLFKIQENQIQFHLLTVVVVACNGNIRCKELDLDEDTNPVSYHNSGGCNFRRGGRNFWCGGRRGKCFKL